MKSRLIFTFMVFFTGFSATLLAGNVSSANLLCSAAFSNGNRYSHNLHPKLQKEVVDLEDNKTINENTYNEFPVDEIGRAIISRMRKYEVLHPEDIKNDKPVDLQRDADIIIFFRSEDVDSIAEFGFLNQHEIGKSRGIYSPKGRVRVEDNYTGIKMGESPQANKMRPKSGFLNIRTDTELAQKNHPMVGKYGNIGAVMKSEVKDRSAWTSIDSLGLGARGEKTSSSLMEWRGTFDRGSISLTSDSSLYYEAVIYGKVSVENVDYFLVTELSQIDLLKPLGKPVFMAKYVYRNKRVIYEKGDYFIKARDDS